MQTGKIPVLFPQGNTESICFRVIPLQMEVLEMFGLGIMQWKKENALSFYLQNTFHSNRSLGNEKLGL